MRVRERNATMTLTAFSIGLLVGGFIAPPMGKIDGSVLAAAGILFAFSALWVAAYAINVKGGSAKVRHGQTEIELETDDNGEN